MISIFKKKKTFSEKKAELISYQVRESPSMFGFNDYADMFSNRKYEIVLARNAYEAAYRYMRRKNRLYKFTSYDERPTETSDTFGKLEVIASKYKNFKKITYWG
jgi:hypothetical protein